MRLRLISLFLASIAAFAADPVLGPVTIKPTFIPPGTPTQVTLTVQIADTTLLANGANVQRLNAAGTATGVVGTLRDDGQNGDAVANDRIFTLVFSLNEPNPGRVYLRAGGAFPNLTTRVPSSTVVIEVGTAATPLTIDGTATPVPNQSGWNRQDVTITYACSGGAGGSATCPAIARVTTEGKAQPIVGTANDGTGNAVSKTIPINLDRTPPSLFITSPPNNSVVATPTLLLSGTATDAVSGIASFTCNGQSAALSGPNFTCNVPLVPGANAVTVQATDNAGNTATATTNVVFSFTTLTLSAAATPAPNTLGWNNSDVNIAFTCTGGAMPVKCPADLIVSTEGGNQVIARTATDALNSTASSSVTLKIDKTPPALTVTTPPAAAAVTNPQLTISGTATDTLSGLARVVCGTVQATLTGNAFTCNVTLINGLNNLAIQAVDNAGNTATVNRVVTLGNQLTISATPTPAPNPAGWNNTNVTVSFTCAGGVGTVTCPQPVTAAAEGDNVAVSRTATDGGGNSATASVTLKIDKTAPVVAVTSPANGATVATASVTFTGTVTEALSGLTAFTCNGAIAAVAQSTFTCDVKLNPGANTIVFQATDRAGNVAATSLSITYTTPKLLISAAPAPGANAAGWHNANVTVSYTCSGGAGTITCPLPVTVTTEGGNQTITRTATDTSGNSASASVTLRIDKTPPSLAITTPSPGTTVATPQITLSGTISDSLSGIESVLCNNAKATLAPGGYSCAVPLVPGANTVLVQALDLAGNPASASVSVTRSTAGPVISLSGAPAPNAAGWNNANITVSATCSGGTGAVICPQPLVVSTEAANQVITRTATDSIGNSTSASITLNIDKTPPAVAITTPANGATVNTPQIAVSGSLSDTLSGVSSVLCNAVTGTISASAYSCVVPLVSGSNTITVQVTDKAGNTASAAVNVTRTTTGPVITLLGTPAANGAGWNNANVTVTATCSGGAGAVTCPPPLVVSTEAANQVITRTATDSIGNSTSASITLNIDKTPPAVAITAPANGATVNTPQISVTGSLSDTLSGVSSVLCNAVTGTISASAYSCVVPLASGSNTISVQLTDKAGNTASASVNVTRTTTGPVITLLGTPSANGAGWNNASVTVSATCSGGTGAVTCPQPLVVATEAANQVITRTATDSIGNSTSASVTLNIDKTPPVVAITSPANGATVNTPQVTLTGSISDALSGVTAVQCNAVPGTITATSYSCVVPLVSGPNTVTVQATDKAGNIASASVNITLTTTGPVITLLGTPAANGAGWNNANVTVSATCSGGTGAVTCPQPLLVSTEGANQGITRTATDSIGNSTSVTLTLNIDKTAPVVAITSPANGATVNTTSVIVTGSTSDALSGVATVLCNAVPAILTASTYTCTVPLVAGANTITVQASDKAGNAATASVNINLPTAGPVISLLGTPAANSAGWNNTNVTVSATCSGGTGAVTCPQPLVVSTEAANQVISRTATDSLGNSTSASLTLNIDKTQPLVAITAPAPGATVSTATVSISGTASDALSGLSSVLCNTVVATVTQSTYTCVVPLVSGANTITVQATDKAGNASSSSIVVNSTASVLSLLLSALPTPNAAGWNNADVTVSATCTGGNGAVTCPAPLVVSTEGANQVITRTATDAGGGTVNASVTLRIDKTPPLVAITTPAPGTTVLTPQASITGSISDALSGVAAVTCNGVSAVVASGTFTCSVTLSLGPNSIAVVASDVAGNTSTASVSITLAPPLTISLSSPSNLSYLNLSPTTVSGTVSDSTATVVINGISTPVAGGAFSAQIPLAEGPNLLTATGTLPNGATATATVSVMLDTTPPRVTILNPPDKFVTADASIAVSGSVNDIVVGTVNDQQAQVTVNGLSAQVSNRTFLAASVPLAMGDNVIRAVGRDRAGNSVTTQVTVTRQNVTGPAIRLLSGNNQSAAIGAALPAPLVVALADGSGAPIANKPVIFKVTQNDGLISAGSAPAATVIANTNAQGQAQVQWTLGFRAGAGGNVVEAYSVGHAGTAVFSATGNQGPAGKIVIDTGNAQIGVIGQSLPKPFIAVVVDAGNNRLAGVPVTFRVTQGGGTINGQPSYTVNSDSDGRVAALLTLGFQEGNANNLVEASFTGNTGYPAAFTASGRAPGNPAQTSISGVVLDNSNAPIPGVTVRAVLTNTLNSNSSSIQSVAAVQTNAQGQFTIPNAPVGFVKLLVDGSTAQLAGKYPTLDYDLVTISGQPNAVGQPIYLLPLNSANQLCVTASTGGGTLTIADAPGFSLTFGPGQVAFPGGSKTGCVTVTVVHPDKVPMSPGFGQQPRFIVTIQPAGAIFNPPAPITLPNVDGLKPRQVTEMYSFDHDIGSFVAIGTGTVSDDGQVIRSSSGVGVLKAGWHCGGDPNARGTVADCPVCQYCQGPTADANTQHCMPNPGTIRDQCAPRGNPCLTGTCGGRIAVGDPPHNEPTGICEISLVQGPCTLPGGLSGTCSGGICVGRCPTTCPNGCVNGVCVTNSCQVGQNSGPCDMGGRFSGQCENGQCVGDRPDECPAYCNGSTCLNGVCTQPCNGTNNGALCNAGGRLPGICTGNNSCQGDGDQCPTSCNGGRCINGRCAPSGNLKISKMWSRQTGETTPSNYLSDTVRFTGKESRYVLMGTSGGQTQVGVTLSISNSRGNGTVYVALKGLGSGPIDLSSQVPIPLSDGTVTINLDTSGPNYAITNYQVVAGIDTNSNHVLDWTEITEETESSLGYLKVVPEILAAGAAASLAVTAETAAVAGCWIVVTPCPVAASMLLAFSTNSTPFGAFAGGIGSPVPDRNELGAFDIVDLTHHVGATFDPGGNGPARVPEFVFPSTSLAASKVRRNEEFKRMLYAHLDNENGCGNGCRWQALIRRFFQQNPNEASHDFLIPIPPASISFTSDADLVAGFNSVAFRNLALKLSVRRNGLTLTVQEAAIVDQGLSPSTMVDVYDFDYEAGALNAVGATAQAAFSRVFRIRVLLAGTIEGFSYFIAGL